VRRQRAYGRRGRNSPLPGDVAVDQYAEGKRRVLLHRALGPDRDCTAQAVRGYVLRAPIEKEQRLARDEITDVRNELDHARGRLRFRDQRVLVDREHRAPQTKTPRRGRQ
jgi:hypothetical protein